MKRIVFLLFLFAVAARAEVTTQTFTATFTCTGSTGPFTFTFPLSAPNTLTVTENGTVLATSAYTISPVNNNYANGGSVTLSAPCASGTLILARSTPLTQARVFTDNMPTPMKQLESGLDKLTEIAQELSAATSAKASPGTCPLGQVVSATTTTGVVCVGGGGGGGGGGSPGGSAFSLQYNAAGLFGGSSNGSIDAAGNIKALSVQSNVNGVVNVKASPYNAVGDCVADDTAAFQAAALAVRNTGSNIGGHLVIPPGCYNITDSINFTGGTSFLRGLHIEGSGTENTLIKCTLPSGKAYPCFDFTGASQDALVEKLQIDGIAGGYQTTGILFARSSTVDGGTGSDDGTIRGVRIDGNFAKAGLAGISADTIHLEDSSIQCAGPCTTVVYWTAIDHLGIPSEYQTFNTSSIAFTQAFFERDALYYYNTVGGTVGSGDGAGAAFRFDGATGKLQVLNTFIAKNNTSGNVADIRASGGNTFQSSLTLANVRSENNLGAANFFLDMENGEAIEGGNWDVSIASTNTALTVFYMANSSLIQFVTPANMFIDQHFTWTAGDGTGQFQNNDFNLEQGFGTWGTAFDTAHSYANSITTNNGLGPIPGFSAGGTLLSGIVRQSASSSLYSFTNNFIGTGSPWNICNANASTTSCTSKFSVDNTGITTQSSDANIGGNANISNLMHSQQSVISTPGASSSLGSETLSNPSLTGGTSWTAGTSPGGLDCVTIGNPTTCSYTAGNTQGWIIQGTPSMAIAPQLSTAYYFCYTVTASTLVAANGDNAFILNDVTEFVHQPTNVYLPVTVGTHCVDIVSNSSAISALSFGFNINTVGASITFGTLTLKQNLNAVSINQGNLSAGTNVAAPSFTVNGGTPVTSQSSATGQMVTCAPGGSGTQVCDASGAWVNLSGAATIPFNDVTAATNTNTLTVGTGGSIVRSGTGIVDANQVNSATIPTSKTIVGTNGSGQIVDASSATLANTTTGDSGGITGGVLGTMWYQSAPNTTAALAPNTSVSTLCLTQTGTGTVGAAPVWGACSGSTATAFSALTGSTNTSAAMLCGTGCSLGPTGSGTVNANQINGGALPTTATVTGTDASGKIIDASAATLTNNTSGNAATATALAASPSNCSAGQAPRGINASGVAQNCTTYTQTICSGTIALSTGAIALASTHDNTATCTGLLTTDNIQIDFASDPTAVTGYGVSGNVLTIYKFPTANTIHVVQGNNANNSGSITPGAITVNYRVWR